MTLCECGCGRPTGLARVTSKARGWVKGEPLRYLHGHGRRRRVPPPRVEDTGFGTPCWLWAGSLDGKGYPAGQAHRRAYEDRHGPIPPDLDIDHLCRVPRCINPDHLEPVPHAVNIRRGASAKLTMTDARAIRASTEPSAVLAERYGVGRRAISQVRANNTWKEVA